MHTIFYGINMGELYDESHLNGTSPDEKALALAVIIHNEVVHQAVQWGRLLKKDAIPMPESGYALILDANYILKKDGNFFKRVEDLDDIEKSLFYEIGGLKFSSKSDQERENIRIKFEDMLDNKYRKVKPANALDSLYTEPFNVENDILLIRDRSDSSDKNRGSPGLTANIESMVIETQVSNTLDFPVYSS